MRRGAPLRPGGGVRIIRERVVGTMVVGRGGLESRRLHVGARPHPSVAGALPRSGVEVDARGRRASAARSASRRRRS
jgi:hypothetical protein